MLFGYARVSTENQSLDRQTDALTAVGIKEENIYKEKMSGAKSNRPRLNALIETVEKGDVVVVESLSRLGRSAQDLLTIMQTLSDKGVVLKSLKEQLDFGSPQGKLMTHLFALISEFERDVIRNRVIEGVAAARARGRTGGRPATPQKTIDKALQMYNQHNLTVTEICRACGISRPTLYKALRQRAEKQELESIDNQ